MLDVRRMQILRAVVTSGSVTAAAANLGYTPSAISQQIAVLEKETRTALLERIGRGVRPTAAGRLLSDYARTIGAQVAEAESALADLREGRTGRLSVRYFATAGATLLPPALARLRRDHPGIAVDLRLIDPEDPLPAVERGEADLAVVVRPHGSAHDGVELVHLLDDPYLAVLPKGHALAGKRVLDLADLAGEPWVSTETGPVGPCLEILLDGCAAAGFTPGFVVESDDYATAQGFVAAGLGVCLIPRTGLGTRHAGVVVREVRRPRPFRAIHAAVRRSSLGQPALHDLITALRETAAE
ncbi:LysR family transcriptional regulator [Phytomonospora endophytica]|uniref:DNA-binding transcriptional LysR family regulator n=1 Tax=Phytomonospora endophytica TaxID=714109 RepID=A0A841F8W9_9ACTN|nr:LysR family transcriptional regulator [Phytomonospora endophytica]MBB6032204.1 DNA-binding transcriptional LysR family regulator [Phytomonospora endophytica]GIG68553.1 LysR family transcriptional regulator [Phytomonospora endophytica]